MEVDESGFMRGMNPSVTRPTKITREVQKTRLTKAIHCVTFIQAVDSE